MRVFPRCYSHGCHGCGCGAGLWHTAMDRQPLPAVVGIVRFFMVGLLLFLTFFLVDNVCVCSSSGSTSKWTLLPRSRSLTDQATEALLECKPDKKTDPLFTVDMIKQIVGQSTYLISFSTSLARRSLGFIELTTPSNRNTKTRLVRCLFSTHLCLLRSGTRSIAVAWTEN